MTDAVTLGDTDDDSVGDNELVTDGVVLTVIDTDAVADCVTEGLDDELAVANGDTVVDNVTEAEIVTLTDDETEDDIGEQNDAPAPLHVPLEQFEHTVACATELNVPGEQLEHAVWRVAEL